MTGFFSAISSASLGIEGPWAHSALIHLRSGSILNWTGMKLSKGHGKRAIAPVQKKNSD